MTPLERAARALARQDAIDRLHHEPSERDINLSWRAYVKKARATLLAVREPSVTMVEAGVVAIWGDAEIDPDMRGNMGFAFAAMVDALLGEGPAK